MPQAISDAGIRFPVGYSPWYVYEATLVASPNDIEFMDLLLADGSGTFDRPNTAVDLVLEGGYCFALEVPVSGQTVIQVAVPGSLVPLIAGEDLQPEELVKMNTGADPFPQTVEAVTALGFASGFVLGRYRNLNTNAQNLRTAVDGDIIYVLTGLT